MAVTDEIWFQAVAEAVREKDLPAGQCLFRQGDATTGIYAVVSGRLRLTRHTSEGTEVVLHVASAGETFAEAALFSDRYHCDATADMASTVALLPTEAVRRAMAADPRIAEAFMARLARQVQVLRGRLELRNIRSAPERVLQFLLLNGKDGVAVFDRPLKDVAAEAGLTHEAFYRALAALEKQERITRQGRAITVIRRDPA